MSLNQIDLVENAKDEATAKRRMAQSILEYALEYYGENTAIPMFRKHAAWYSAGMPNSSEFRIRVNQIVDANVLKVAIRDFWGII